MESIIISPLSRKFPSLESRPANESRDVVEIPELRVLGPGERLPQRTSNVPSFIGRHPSLLTSARVTVIHCSVPLTVAFALISPSETFWSFFCYYLFILRVSNYGILIKTSNLIETKESWGNNPKLQIKTNAHIDPSNSNLVKLIKLLFSSN